MLGGRHSRVWKKIISIQAVYLLLNTYISFPFPFPINKVIYFANNLLFLQPWVFSDKRFLIKITVFWIVTACNLVDRYQCHFVNCLIWELVYIIVACSWQDHTIYVNVNLAHSHQCLSHGYSQLLPTVMKVLSLGVIHYMQ
jgi:hypothetical protein